MAQQDDYDLWSYFIDEMDDREQEWSEWLSLTNISIQNHKQLTINCQSISD